MEKVRIGLIGLGLMGTPHARILKKVDECDLVAAAEVDEKQKKVAEELGIKFYKNYEEMIEKESLQGVILALPNHLHAPIGIACAQKGSSSFCRKAHCPERRRGGPPHRGGKREQGSDTGGASKEIQQSR